LIINGLAKQSLWYQRTIFYIYIFLFCTKKIAQTFTQILNILTIWFWILYVSFFLTASFGRDRVSILRWLPLQRKDYETKCLKMWQKHGIYSGQTIPTCEFQHFIFSEVETVFVNLFFVTIFHQESLFVISCRTDSNCDTGLFMSTL